ncbi:MAG TPA: cell division protein SepF [Firmicutes bacterium]|nr:cell division protein SepF [Bacillota bacterium]
MGILDRVLDFMGFKESGGEDPGVPEDDSPPFEDVYLGRGGAQDPKMERKIVSLHSARQARLVIKEPKSFDDVQEIADNLKSRRPVIVNVSTLDKETARRILDVASGVTYALDGGMQKIGEGIFLFTPSNFEVMGEVGGDEEDSPPFFTQRPSPTLR